MKTITRKIKESTQTYEYKGKKINFDRYVQFRENSEKFKAFEYLALKKGYNGYASYLRDIIEKELDDNNVNYWFKEEE